jgi:hypothetical protein
MKAKLIVALLLAVAAGWGQSPGIAMVTVSGATPTLTTTAGYTVFNWTLTTNVGSSSFSSVAVGAGALNLCEDSTGGRTVAFPANFVGFAPMASTAANYCQHYTWEYDGTNVTATSLTVGTVATAPTAGGFAYGASSSAYATTGACTAKQIPSSGGASAPTCIDFPHAMIVPAANCVAGTAGSGWNTASSNFTAACRAGTNNLGGALQAIPSTGASAQFQLELPLDWDSGVQPYINIFYGSGANTSGTVIWTVSSACSKADGSVSDDGAFNAESAFGSQTMAAASRTWSKSGQFTAVTSGNNCVPGGTLLIKVAVSGTAASAINAYQAVVTIPRLLTVQGN